MLVTSTALGLLAAPAWQVLHLQFLARTAVSWLLDCTCLTCTALARSTLCAVLCLASSARNRLGLPVFDEHRSCLASSARTGLGPLVLGKHCRCLATVALLFPGLHGVLSWLDYGKLCPCSVWVALSLLGRWTARA